MADPSEPINFGALLETIADHFSVADLQTLCLDLDIDYADLPVPESAGRRDKIRALVVRCHREQRLDRLLAACAAARPHTDWQAFAPLAQRDLDDNDRGAAVDPPPVRQATAATRAPRTVPLRLVGGVVLVALVAVALLFLNGRPGAQDGDGEAATTVQDPTAVARAGATSGPADVSVAAPTVAATAAALPPDLPATATPSPVMPTPAALNVSNSEGRSDNPQLGLDGLGRLHLVWRDATLRPGGDFFHRVLAGGDWSATTNLTDGFNPPFTGSLWLGQNPAGDACMAWYGNSDTAPLALYGRCNGEAGWSSPQSIPRGKADNVIIYGRDGAPHLLSTGLPAIYFDGQEISDAFGAFNTAAAFDLAVDGAGNYHAVWERLGNVPHVTHRMSNDGGQTWGEPAYLTETREDSGHQMRLVGDGRGGLHLVWYSFDGRFIIRHWTPAAGWDTAAVLPTGNLRSNCTSFGLAADAAGRLYLAWQSGPGLYAIWSQADGSWSPPRQLATAYCAGRGPAVDVDEAGMLHLAWSNAETDDIYYATLDPDRAP